MSAPGTASAEQSSGVPAPLGDGQSASASGQSPPPASLGVETISTVSGNTNAVGEDADALYVATDSARLFRVDKRTFASESIATVPMYDVFAIAVDVTDVYFTALIGDVGLAFRVPKHGGVPVRIGVGAVLRGIAVDADKVYWTDEGNYGADSGGIFATPKAGGSTIALATGERGPRAIVLDERTVFWGTDPNGGINGALRSIPKTGGTPETLVSGIDAAMVRLVGSALYWAGEEGIQTRGASGETVMVTAGLMQAGFAVDASGAYFAGPDAHGGEVMRVPLSGGAPTTFMAASPADKTGRPLWDETFGILTDACFVYSIEATTSAGVAVSIVRRVAKTRDLLVSAALCDGF